MTRQVIQIATLDTTVNGKPMPYIFALCNDGTMWTIANAHGATWKPLAEIPQPVAVGEVSK